MSLRGDSTSSLFLFLFFFFEVPNKRSTCWVEIVEWRRNIEFFLLEILEGPRHVYLKIIKAK